MNSRVVRFSFEVVILPQAKSLWVPSLWKSVAIPYVYHHLEGTPWTNASPQYLTGGKCFNISTIWDVRVEPQKQVTWTTPSTPYKLWSLHISSVFCINVSLAASLHLLLLPSLLQRSPAEGTPPRGPSHNIMRWTPTKAMDDHGCSYMLVLPKSCRIIQLWEALTCLTCLHVQGSRALAKGLWHTMTYHDYERLNAVLCSTVAEKSLSQLAVHGLNIDPNRWASGRVSEDCSKVFVGCDAHFFPEWQAIRMRMFNSCAWPGDSNGKKQQHQQLPCS